jgi:hypothetical protein
MPGEISLPMKRMYAFKVSLLSHCFIIVAGSVEEAIDAFRKDRPALKDKPISSVEMKYEIDIVAL